MPVAFVHVLNSKHFDIPTIINLGNCSSALIALIESLLDLNIEDENSLFNFWINFCWFIKIVFEMIRALCQNLKEVLKRMQAKMKEFYLVQFKFHKWQNYENKEIFFTVQQEDQNWNVVFRNCLTHIEFLLKLKWYIRKY